MLKKPQTMKMQSIDLEPTSLLQIIAHAYSLDKL